jgi:hypothetical protein
VKNLEGKICPWVGCGGTIKGTGYSIPKSGNRWCCDMCGEPFKSFEDYERKINEENDWAMSWIDWSSKMDMNLIESESKEDASLVEVDEA